MYYGRQQGNTAYYLECYNMSTMSLAWSNARTAATWHGQGTAKQYLAGSLSLAHKGVNLKKRLVVGLVVALPCSFALGLAYGALLASL